MKKLIIILLSLASCGPGYQLKRARINEAKAVAEGAIIKHDTVFITRIDTIVGPSADFPISWINTGHHDTVIVTQHHIKLVQNFKHDTLYRIRVVCPDSVLRRRIGETNNTTICPPVDNTWRNSAIGAGVFILLLIVIIYFLTRAMLSKDK